jgi:hypothetical protein
MAKRWSDIWTTYHEGSEVPFKSVVCGEEVSGENAQRRKGQLGAPVRANLAV